MGEVKSAWVARAPSNIALIKYMGKSDSFRNIPENGSLSFTLNRLCTVVELEKGVRSETDASSLRWLPEKPCSEKLTLDAESDAESPTELEQWLRVPSLGNAGISRMIRHVERVREAARARYSEFGIALSDDLPGERSASWILRSANTFPAASGIASSASFFAALTMAAAAACAKEIEAFSQAWERDSAFRSFLAGISREGSGSSCRSFDGPYVEWEGEMIHRVESKLPELAHFVLLITEQGKEVSSSEAHARVKGSPLWSGRVERVTARLARLREAIRSGDMAEVSRLSWVEFWEMHSLFHTSADPFTYWQPATLALLQQLSGAVKSSAPPIVTMDAGPNIHVLVEATRASEWSEKLSHWMGGGKVLRDSQGAGPRLLFPAGARGARG